MPLRSTRLRRNSRPGERRVPGFTPVLYGPNFQITLEPGKTMSGVVRDPQGNPVPGAQVQTMPGWGIHVVSTSDADGRFTLSGLRKKEKYLVRVGAKVGDSQLGESIEVPDTDGLTPITADITLRKRD